MHADYCSKIMIIRLLVQDTKQTLSAGRWVVLLHYCAIGDKWRTKLPEIVAMSPRSPPATLGPHQWELFINRRLPHQSKTRKDKNAGRTFKTTSFYQIGLNWLYLWASVSLYCEDRGGYGPNQLTVQRYSALVQHPLDVLVRVQQWAKDHVRY